MTKVKALGVLLPYVKKEQHFHVATLKDKLKVWEAVCFLFPCLHPDDICGPNKHKWMTTPGHCTDVAFDRYCEDCGWPEALEDIAYHVWALYAKKDISDRQFYNARAACAGIDAGL